MSQMEVEKHYMVIAQPMNESSLTSNLTNSLANLKRKVDNSVKVSPKSC